MKPPISETSPRLNPLRAPIRSTARIRMSGQVIYAIASPLSAADALGKLKLGYPMRSCRRDLAHTDRAECEDDCADTKWDERGQRRVGRVPKDAAEKVSDKCAAVADRQYAGRKMMHVALFGDHRQKC